MVPNPRKSWFGLCFFGGLLATSLAQATETSRKLYFGAGVISSDAGRLANSPDGAVSLTTTLLPQLSLAANLELAMDWGISPIVTYTPLGHKSPEGGEKTTLLAVGARLTKTFEELELRLGPGMLFYTVSGSGGTVVENNGTSTATFGLPANSSTADVLYFDGGLGVKWNPVRLDFDALITDTFSSRRAVSLMATVSYGLF